jgi:hypothetical protein
VGGGYCQRRNAPDSRYHLNHLLGTLDGVVGRNDIRGVKRSRSTASAYATIRLCTCSHTLSFKKPFMAPSAPASAGKDENLCFVEHWACTRTTQQKGPGSLNRWGLQVVEVAAARRTTLYGMRYDVMVCHALAADRLLQWAHRYSDAPIPRT